MEKQWRYVLCTIILTSFIFLYLEFSHQILNTARHTILPGYQHLGRTRPFNKTQCKGLASLKSLLLAVNYNSPHYSSIPVLLKFYGDIFGRIVFCGSTKHPDVITVDEHNGYLGYRCLSATIRMYPQFKGYLQINDDVILNWWSLLNLDISKIWVGSQIEYKHGYEFGSRIKSGWHWWKTVHAAYLCKVAFGKVSALVSTKEGKRMHLQHYMNRYFQNTNNRKLCVHHWAETFYIPREYSHIYAKLSQIYEENNVFLEVAVPGILAFLLNKTNHLNLNGFFLNAVNGYSPTYLSGQLFYEKYTFDTTFYHPFKLDGDMKVANWNFLKNVLMTYAENVRQYCLFHKAKVIT